MPYLVDTDVTIEILLARERIVAAVDRLASEGLAISIIAVGEIYEGAFRAANPYEHLRTFRALLRPYRVIRLSDRIMERFAALRFNLRRTGQLIPDFDLVLCATALEHDLTLLTNNLRHMPLIPDLRVYSPR